MATAAIENRLRKLEVVSSPRQWRHAYTVVADGHSKGEIDAFLAEQQVMRSADQPIIVMSVKAPANYAARPQRPLWGYWS
jgi:hypothetical protein